MKDAWTTIDFLAYAGGIQVDDVWIMRHIFLTILQWEKKNWLICFRMLNTIFLDFIPRIFIYVIRPYCGIFETMDLDCFRWIGYHISNKPIRMLRMSHIYRRTKYFFFDKNVDSIYHLEWKFRLYMKQIINTWFMSFSTYVLPIAFSPWFLTIC